MTPGFVEINALVRQQITEGGPGIFKAQHLAGLWAQIKVPLTGARSIGDTRWCHTQGLARPVVLYVLCAQ